MVRKPAPSVFSQNILRFYLLPNFYKINGHLKLLLIILVRSSGISFFCLFIYLFLAYESLVTKKSVLKSPFSLSFQIVYPFISCNFYFICCDAILLSEGQRKHVFVMNFIPQHYHAFLLESGLSDINIANPAFSFFSTLYVCGHSLIFKVRPQEHSFQSYVH